MTGGRGTAETLDDMSVLVLLFNAPARVFVDCSQENDGIGLKG
jgi:hypothetical protein